MTPQEEIKKIIGDRTQKRFAEEFNIPLRTVEDWTSGRRTPPPYVIELLKIADEKNRR